MITRLIGREIARLWCPPWLVNSVAISLSMSVSCCSSILAKAHIKIKDTIYSSCMYVLAILKTYIGIKEPILIGGATLAMDLQRHCSTVYL